MKRNWISLAFLSIGLASVALAATDKARAQGAEQIITLEQINPTVLTDGYRASKIIGASVVNGKDETVGTVDDLIVTPTGTVPFAVLSVGGFLGVGDTLVVVPANAFERKDGALLLRGATKENLKRLPPFTYSE